LVAVVAHEWASEICLSDGGTIAQSGPGWVRLDFGGANGYNQPAGLKLDG
jgi:hypothetical protein